MVRGYVRVVCCVDASLRLVCVCFVCYVVVSDVVRLSLCCIVFCFFF